MSIAPAHAPDWPSLYNPGVEIVNIQGRDAIQPNGEYLYRARDVFRFTLYWTLCLYTPAFILCGLYAFWNLNFPPTPTTTRADKSYTIDNGADNNNNNTSSFQLNYHHHRYPHHQLQTPSKPKENARRSRLAFAFLVLLTFLTISVAGAVLGSAVLGFTVFGLYRSAGFNMSTWIPFLLAVMQVLAGFLSIWPSIIDVI